MSLRSPRASGFHQLPPDHSRYDRDDMPFETDIPLTNVRTAASSTGGRRQGDTIAYTMSEAPLNEEKSGLFKRGPAGRRKAPELGRRTSEGEVMRVNSLGRLYHKIVNFSVVTRYLVYVVPIAAILAIPIIIYAVLNPNALFASTGVRVYLFWTWIEVLWISLWVSKLVAKIIPFLFMFLCGVVSPGTRKYADILRAVEIPLSLVGWAVAGLVTFTALMSPNLNFGNNEKWIGIMKKLLAPALIAALIYLGEQLVIQLISVNYHRRSFEGRIKDSKHSIHLLGLLFDASRTLFPMYCPEFEEEDYVINDSIEALVSKNVGHRVGHSKQGSLNPVRIIGNVGRIGDKVTSVFGNLASEITGKHVFNPNSAHSIVIEALEKTRSSEALAKRLWMSFVVEGNEALFPDDIREVLGPAHSEAATEAFEALDGDGNGDISLDEMIMKVIEMGKERKAISSSMRDVGQAIGVLDQIMSAILAIIIIFIFVAFQNTNFVTTLATAGTTLLSLSFVFAVTAQEFLGSCIFLFVKHPYDVGDRVDITGPTAENLVVEQISLLYTIFKRVDNHKLVQVPNIVLNSLWIENVTRSKAMKEQLDMFISFDTTLEDIELLRTEMESFVRHPDNARDFYPDMLLEATGIGNMDKLQLSIEIRHKSNWHNETVRAARRSKFMCALVLALRKVPIYAPGGGGEPLGGPTNPGYSVSVPDTWASEARDAAAKAKESRRLIPTNPAPSARSNKFDGTLGSVPEEAAASALNARRPTLDASYDSLTRTTSATSRPSADVSRAESTGKRSMDNTGVSQNNLVQRKSTRGRRKRGDTSTTTAAGTGPAFSITQPSPQVSPRPSHQDAQSPYQAQQSPYQTQGAYQGQGYGSPRVGDEEAELGIHELSGQPGRSAGQGQMDYESYHNQHQGTVGQHPLEQQQNQQGYANPNPASPQAQQAQTQSQQMRLQRLSLGLGNPDEREDGFL